MLLLSTKKDWIGNVRGDVLAGLVVTGFVNALAILIFMAQLPELTNVTWHVYSMTAAGLAIINLFPYLPVIGKVIPSPLVCILVLTAVAMILNIDIRTVGDMGKLPDTLPIFIWPDVAFSFDTLSTVFPYALALAVVGILESLMAALVAVMIMVSIGTFDWRSIRNLKKHPLSTNTVMIATVIVMVLSHNLAYGVFVGVLLASMFFANRISHFMYSESELDSACSIRTYRFHGQIFFNSADKFLAQFNFKEAVSTVVIDLSRAHFWDITAVYSLDMAVLKFRREGAKVDIIGLNRASETIIDRFGVHDKPEQLARVLGGH